MRLNIFLFLLLFQIWSCGSTNQFVDFNEKEFNIINIKIDSTRSGLGACEPSIAINYTKPSNMVAGGILDKIYVSEDSGRTWSIGKLESSYGVYGDPVVRADYQGNFYYSHLSNPTGRAWQDEEFLDRIVVQKSIDGGKTWSDGSFTKPDNPKDQDKQWKVVDPNDNAIYMTWTEFDKYNSADSEDKSRIKFCKSVDGGKSWTTPVSISEREGDCLDGDQTTEGAVPAIGPNSELYVAWAYDEKIYFDRSFDKGNTWLNNDIVVANQPEGWDISIPGLMRCNGMPITKVDLSKSKYRGDIYINWTDQRNGENNTDIWISKSSDGGENWSSSVKVNNDNGIAHQFFTAMDIDQKTGYIYVVFYDRRAYAIDDISTDVYLAISKDGGASFENIKINELTFRPSQFIFFGDYNDLSVFDGIVRPIWTSLHESELAIWTAIIDANN